jgi:predicted RNase H-like HicB family nuclease
VDEMLEFVKDLSQLKESLNQYQGLLERQREATIKSQFRDFSQSLGIVATGETINSLFQNFEQVNETLENGELLLKDRIIQTLDSDFVQQVLTLKTAARESELRRMTSDLSEFIRDVPTADNDSQFIQNLMAKSLKTLAQEVSLQKDLGETYNEAWIQSLQEQANEIFKNL